MELGKNDSFPHILSPYGSQTSLGNEGLINLTKVAVQMKETAEKVFRFMDETVEHNIFLNVPNFVGQLILMASVGHSLPSKEIKELLFNVNKFFKEEPLFNMESARLLCLRASRDLMAWDMQIKQQCLFNEYESRRRLYVSRVASQTYSFRTFQSLNALMTEIKVSQDASELNEWAIGKKEIPSEVKSIFKTWEYIEGKEEKVETKEKKKTIPSPISQVVKPKEREKKSRVPPGHKCPILMAVTSFEIPIHPFLLDMSSTYVLRTPSQCIRVVRLINDRSKMLRHFTIDIDYRGACIPLRLKDDGDSLELMIFWGGQKTGNKYSSILSMVGAIHSKITEPSKQPEVQETTIRELQLPLWETIYQATNMAWPISQRITSHLFTEGGFGDLADPYRVVPNADPAHKDPPAIQSFDFLTIRTPDFEGMKPKDLDVEMPLATKEVIRVSLPYQVVIFDKTIHCPVYFGRISTPLVINEDEKAEEIRWKRPIRCTLS